MMTQKELIKKAKLAYQIAEEHGWHEQKRTFHDLIALINGELGEAVEELREDPDPFKIRTAADGKPEGFTVEIADFAIRIFDMIGYFSESGDQPFEILAKGYEETRERVAREAEVTLPTTTFVCVIGHNLFTAWQDFQTGRATEGVFMLGVILGIIEDWFFRNSQSLSGIITVKMEYNKTRPYRHGGKHL